MLLIHSHVGCSKLLLKAELKLNLHFLFEFRLRVSCLENSDEHTATSLGNPKGKVFRTSNWNLFYFNLCLVLLLCISAETLALSLQLFSYQIALLFSKPSFLWAKQSQLLQLFFRGRCCPFFAEPIPVMNVILVLVLKLAAFSQV